MLTRNVFNRSNYEKLSIVLDGKGGRKVFSFPSIYLIIFRSCSAAKWKWMPASLAEHAHVKVFPAVECVTDTQTGKQTGWHTYIHTHVYRCIIHFWDREGRTERVQVNQTLSFNFGKRKFYVLSKRERERESVRMRGINKWTELEYSVSSMCYIAAISVTNIQRHDELFARLACNRM